MLKEIAEALKPREERVVLAGHTLVVREVANAAKFGDGAERDDIFYHLMVASVFTEDGKPALTVEDIPTLKASGRGVMAALTMAVTRVNGMDFKGETEKSEAGPS